MSDSGHLDIDGHLLRLLLAVSEEGSVTRAADRLGVTQSAVSHGLDKLRAIVGDALFVRSGRGIVATAQAQLLTARARVLLDDLRGFAAAAGFEPARLSATVTVAANDLQRDLLLPGWLARLRAQAPGLRLRVIPSGVPGTQMLREQHCEIVITPRPPEGSDIVQKRLFADGYVVFYDAQRRAAPASLADWLGSEHATVLYEPRRMLDIDEWLAARGIERRFAVQVPGFAGIPAFLRDSTLLATLPSLLGAGLLRGFASAPVPMATPAMPMYMVWHLRHQEDPMHRWLRATLEAAVPPLLSRSPPAAGTRSG